MTVKFRFFDKIHSRYYIYIVSPLSRKFSYKNNFQMSLHDSPVVVVPIENTQQWSTGQPFTTNTQTRSIFLSNLKLMNIEITMSEVHGILDSDLGQMGGGLRYQRLGCRNT